MGKNTTMNAETVGTGYDGTARDLAEVSAVELITTVSVHLLSAAALRCPLELARATRTTPKAIANLGWLRE